jgi:glycine cleavage system protein P-like pyridoxal-binding family
VLQPSLKLHERHGGDRHRRRCLIATPAHAATCAMRAWAAFQFQASSSCN